VTERFSIIVAMVLLVFLIVAGYVLDIADVTTQILSGTLEQAGLQLGPQVSLVFYAKYLIYLIAAGLAVFIVLKVATALKGTRD